MKEINHEEYEIGALNNPEKKTATDIFEELLIALASWKKCSNKDYKILEKIYYKLGGK